MKYDHLSTNELIHYLDLTTTDPMVRRLIELIQSNTLKAELVEVGMDPEDCEFHYEGNYYRPSEYIRQLHSDIDYHQREAADWESQHYEMERERDRLKTRSVADLLHSMEELNRQYIAERDQAKRLAERYAQSNKELNDKINVWKILEN